MPGEAARLLGLPLFLWRPYLARCAVGLLHDREAYAGLVPVLFGDLAPAVFRFLAGLERAFDLRGAFDELVEVHRAELAANHPEIAAFAHLSVSRYPADLIRP